MADILSHLQNHLLEYIIALGLALLCLLIGIIKKRFPLITLILTVLYLLMIAVKMFLPNEYQALVTTIPYLDIIVYGFGGLSIAVSIILILPKHKKKSSSDERPEDFEEVEAVHYTTKTVYFIANRHGTVTTITDSFYQLFASLEPRKKNYLKAISEVYVNHLPVKKQRLLSAINKRQSEIDLEIVLRDERKIKITLSRVPEYYDQRITGYTYADCREEVNKTLKNAALNEAKNKLYTYLCLLDEPIAYYDDVKKAFICTKKMMELLAIETSQLSETDYCKKIYVDDLNMYMTKKQNQNLNTYYYRIKTINGYLWFEEKTLEVDGRSFIIASYKESNPEYQFKSYSYLEMITDINHTYTIGQPFAIVLISFKNIPEINDRKQIDNTDALVAKFFSKFALENHYQTLKVYRFGDIEYGLIFKDFEEYNFMLRSLSNNTSKLLKMDVYIGDVRYQLNNKIGICESKNMLSNSAEELIKGALAALDVASDSQYKNDYCIYYPPKPRKKAFDLIDYSIDTSTQYLDSIYKDDDKN